MTCNSSVLEICGITGLCMELLVLWSVNFDHRPLLHSTPRSILHYTTEMISDSGNDEKLSCIISNPLPLGLSGGRGWGWCTLIVTRAEWYSKYIYFEEANSSSIFFMCALNEGSELWFAWWQVVLFFAAHIADVSLIITQKIKQCWLNSTVRMSCQAFHSDTEKKNSFFTSCTPMERQVHRSWHTKGPATPSMVRQVRIVEYLRLEIWNVKFRKEFKKFEADACI